MAIRLFVILWAATWGLRSPGYAATVVVSSGISQQQEESATPQKKIWEKWTSKVKPFEKDVNEKRLYRLAKAGAILGFISIGLLIIGLFTESGVLVLAMLPFSLLGAIFSIIALVKVSGKPELKRIRKTALTGLIASLLWLAISVILLLASLFFGDV